MTVWAIWLSPPQRFSLVIDLTVIFQKDKFSGSSKEKEKPSKCLFPVFYSKAQFFYMLYLLNGATLMLHSKGVRIC
jgi:hypothetical protein